MEIRVGMFLRKKDNLRFSNKNRYPVVKVYETHAAGPEHPGCVIINAAMRIQPEWVEEITEAQFDEIVAKVDAERPRHNAPAKKTNEVGLPTGSLLKAMDDAKKPPVVSKPVHNPMPFHPGDYIRKKNWTFFNGSDLPAMRVNSIRKSPEADSFYINKYQVYKQHLVGLTPEEATALNTEFNDLTLAKVLLNNSKDTTCIRGSTGKDKKVWTEKEVLRYVFTYNKVNPGMNMNAYRCPHCNEIHVGKVPGNKAIENDQKKSFISRHAAVARKPFHEWLLPNTWVWIFVVAAFTALLIYLGIKH